MKNVELLSPAGNYEKALVAINNGADAIYLAYKKFGARAYADNFDDDSLLEIINYAHKLKVKVYVTFNTLVSEENFEEAKLIIDLLYRSNVDALIIQDLGIIHYIRKNYPDFECHASTQMHIYNQDSLKFLEKLGVTRAVLARECNIDQIRSFKDIKIEKEVFVHGALCISYSGQCLFSSFNNQRSGNQGKCSQSCRMPYKLIKNDLTLDEGYLLSPKDMMNVENINELLQAGIDSFKIEGRMKSVEYVGKVTRIYRNAIDTGCNKLSKSELEEMKIIFNRKYTKGHLFNELGTNLINTFRPNHMGINIGKVIGVNKNRIKIKLTNTLYQYDGIRFIQQKDEGCVVNKIYLNGKLVNSAFSGNIVEIEKKFNITVGADVVKTSSEVLNEKESLINNKKRKKIINIYVKISAYAPLVVDIDDGEYSYTYVSDTVVELANNRAISNDNIIKQFSKLNDTCYCIGDLQIDNDNNSFISLKQLNEIRRKAILEFEDYVLKQFSRKNIPYEYKFDKKINKKDTIKKYIVSINDENQYLGCLKFLDEIEIVTDNFELSKKYNIKLSSSNVYEDSYDDILLTRDLGGIKANKLLDYNLNISNNSSLDLLENFGIKGIFLSVELSDDELERLDYNHSFNIGIVMYGAIKVMSMKYCPVNKAILNNDKQNCQLCKKNKYYLKDAFGDKFYLKGDDTCTMHIYNKNKINKISKQSYYENLGINMFEVVFSDENTETVEAVLESILGKK